MSTPVDLEEELRSGGLVDTHYHIGPELLPRRYDVGSLSEATRGWDPVIVLKNHTYPTTPLAALARGRFGACFLGSVVLNRFAGGLNADAVYGAVSGNGSGQKGEDPPIVVWMPTVHAAAHLRVLGYSFDPRWGGGVAIAKPTDEEAPVAVFDDDLKPSPALSAVLEAVVATGSILATGHLSAKEVMKLTAIALDYGVARIIVTHPHYPSVNLSNEQLRALANHEQVFIEHCFAVHTIEKVPLEEIVASIRATGPDQVVLSTDFGQVFSEPFPTGTLIYARKLQRLIGNSFSGAALVKMFTSNGRRALSIGQWTGDCKADRSKS